MGGKINFGICVVAAIFLFGRQPAILFWVAVAVIIINFWSWGVMRNFLFTSRGKIDLVPDWISTVNMISTFAGIVLLILALIIIF